MLKGIEFSIYLSLCTLLCDSCLKPTMLSNEDYTLIVAMQGLHVNFVCSNLEEGKNSAGVWNKDVLNVD